MIMTAKCKAILGFQNKLSDDLAIQIENIANIARCKHDIRIIEQIKKLVIHVWGVQYSEIKIYGEGPDITHLIHDLYDKSLLETTKIETIIGVDAGKYVYIMKLIGESFIKPESDKSYIERAKTDIYPWPPVRGAIQEVGICKFDCRTNKFKINYKTNFLSKCESNRSQCKCNECVLWRSGPVNITHWLRSRIKFLNGLKQVRINDMKNIIIY